MGRSDVWGDLIFRGVFMHGEISCLGEISAWGDLMHEEISCMGRSDV